MGARSGDVDVVGVVVDEQEEGGTCARGEVVQRQEVAVEVETLDRSCCCCCCLQDLVARRGCGGVE
jgi:hypothetical protein